jgi:5-hydroxyisourate hydrolase
VQRLTTHVLDTYRGGPAAGLEVRLERFSDRGEPVRLAAGTTGTDGRLLLHDGPAALPAAHYRLVFETGAWFAARGEVCRFPRILLHIEAREGERYHLPLYLGPHSFTTYRGS